MNESKIFPTPNEVHFGQFNRAQLNAVNYVKSQLVANNFEFNPPYDIKRHADVIAVLLPQSNWKFESNPEGWKITPMI